MMGAALAYYSIFSFGPLLVISTAVAGLVFGPDAETQATPLVQEWNSSPRWPIPPIVLLA